MGLRKRVPAARSDRPLQPGRCTRMGSCVSKQAAGQAETPATPGPAVVTVVTTEHFVLGGARSATISESNRRTSIFLGSVSGGPISLGFGLILWPSVSLRRPSDLPPRLSVRAQDAPCAHRIAHVRGVHFDAAPAVRRYLLSVPPEERLQAQRIWASQMQNFLSMAGTIAVITAILTGSSVGLLVAVVSDHSPWAAFPAASVVGATEFALLVRVLERKIEAARRDTMADGG
jgi:hypothetical protein